MPRLFIGIPLPPDVAAGLARLAPADLAALRHVDPGLLHFTLAFLGQVEEARVGEVGEAVRTATDGAEGSAIVFDTVGRFPETGRIRIVWAGASGADARVEGLGTVVRAELERRQLPFDRRALRAHVTLARVRDRASAADMGAIADAVAAARVPAGLAFRADAVHVMESRLSAKGPLYSSRARIPLAGPSR